MGGSQSKLKLSDSNLQRADSSFFFFGARLAGERCESGNEECVVGLAFSPRHAPIWRAASFNTE